MTDTQAVTEYFKIPENALSYYREEIEGFNGTGKGHCPFHQDEKKSFSVYDGYRWKCFAGCGSGDVIAFHQKKYGFNFGDTVRALSERAGIRADKTYSLNDIKKMQPEKGYSFQRCHNYKYGKPPYIKPIYKNSQAKKTSRFFTLLNNGRYAWGRKSEPVLYNQELLKERPDEPVYIPEGEADCDTLTGLGVLAVTAGSASDKITPEMMNLLKGRDVYILVDNDDPGKERGKRDAIALKKIAKSIKVIELPDLPNKKGADVTDWIQAGGAKEKLIEIIEKTPELTLESNGNEIKTPRIHVVSIRDFLSMNLPERNILMSPWLPSQGLCMLYGYRGLGKTYILLGVGAALAGGGSFLKWQCSEPRKVLYIDGEMPASVMRERIASVIIGAETEPKDDYFQLITPDLQENGIPDLATLEGQAVIDVFAQEADVIILDNISTLCRAGAENKSEDWMPVQSWALSLRRRGKSIIFVHHEGKNGFQRGTSKREDVLDTVIKLKKPGDYNPSQGLRVEVHFEKSRGIYGDDVKPFEAALSIGEDKRAAWTVKDLEESLTERVVSMLNDGIPQNEIADLLGVAKGTVSKHKKKAEGLGMIGKTKSFPVSSL